MNAIILCVGDVRPVRRVLLDAVYMCEEEEENPRAAPEEAEAPPELVHERGGEERPDEVPDGQGAADEKLACGEELPMWSRTLWR